MSIAKATSADPLAEVIAEHRNASVRGETTGVAAVAGGHQHGEHGCC